MSTGSPGNTQYSVCGSGGLQVILAVPGVQGPTTVIAGAASGTVTSVALSVPSGLTVSGSPVTTSGTLTVAFASGHSIPTTASQATWDAAYTERRQWDGGATNLDAASGRTNLGLGTADSPVFAGLTVSGTANLPHIHGALAGVLYEHVRNTSGAPISALTPYYITGSQGDTDRVAIEPAQANNEALMPAAGITYGALSTNEDGHGAVGGVITGLNTIGFQSGDPVYVAPSGGLTATRPASGIVQAVGVIGRVHASTGSMAVLIGSALQAVAFSGAYGDLSGRPTIPSGADAVPQALGTAAVGVSNDYAREDHVHAMPTAGQVGADAAGTAVATVSGHVAAADPHTQYALESSLATVATSGAYGDLSGLPAIPSGADAVPQALGIAAVGVSNDYAREDHVHAMPTAADVGAAASGHVHGNITNAGAIGSVSGVPIITGTSGVLQAGSFGTASGTFAQGNDARFHDSVTLSASVADILNLSGQELQADDPGADRLLFWDDSESKLAHLQLGTNLSITGTTLNAAGGGGSPGGTTGQLQWNSDGSFAGVANSSVDGNGNITLGTQFISSINGAASAPPVSLTGTWFTGGTSTTTKPAFLLEPTGTTSTNWSTSGTGLGVNAASGFAGNLLDLQVNGTRALTVSSGGSITAPNVASFNIGQAVGIQNNPNGEGAITSLNRLHIYANGAGSTSSRKVCIFAWNTGIILSNGLPLAFEAGTSGALDLSLFRDAANTLAQRNGTNAQVFRVYDTFVSGSDYHRLSVATNRVTLSSITGASVTAAALIPAGAVVVGVTSKITTALGTSNGTTGYKIGTAADDDRWGAITGTAAGTSSDNRNWTTGTVECFPAATNVIVTATGGNFNGTGVIYVSVQYLAGEAD